MSEAAGRGAPDADYRAGVSRLYQGEVWGEGFFSALLAGRPPEQAYAVSLLLQIESEAKVRLRPLLWRHGLSLVEDEAGRAAGIAAAARFRGLPWPEAMRELAALVHPYISRYAALAARAPPEDRPAVEYMVGHEQALYDFATLAAAGDAAGALQRARQQLEYPLSLIHI